MRTLNGFAIPTGEDLKQSCYSVFFQFEKMYVTGVASVNLMWLNLFIYNILVRCLTLDWYGVSFSSALGNFVFIGKNVESFLVMARNRLPYNRMILEQYA